VQDDGRGLHSLEAALRRGSGLAGIKERVWALGGELDWGSGAAAHEADAGADGTDGTAAAERGQPLGGLWLRARFVVEAPASIELRQPQVQP
jgi:two-component system sensor histidine kinase UhpB